MILWGNMPVIACRLAVRHAEKWVMRVMTQGEWNPLCSCAIEQRFSISGKIFPGISVIEENGREKATPFVFYPDLNGPPIFTNIEKGGFSYHE